jgi:hypothetical protein
VLLKSRRIDNYKSEKLKKKKKQQRFESGLMLQAESLRAKLAEKCLQADLPMQNVTFWILSPLPYPVHQRQQTTALGPNLDSCLFL